MRDDLIPKKELEDLKKEIYSCSKPIIFFDDDPDGLSSFLIYYKAMGEGKGVPIKSSPVLDTSFTKKATEYSPDKVFILDKAVVDQEFIDSLKGTPAVWVDHHTPLKLHGVKYFNPRVHTPEEHKPTAYWCYVSADNDKFLWIATVGCVADWYIPEFLDEFIKKYPDILDKKYDDPGKIIFETTLGKLVKIFSFCLKGKISDVIKLMKVLTRIKSPYEILRQETPQGKFIYKYYEKINNMYEEVLKEAMAQVSDDKILLYRYEDSKMSFTADMSNELLHHYPDKITIIARERNGEMKCSLRSGKYKIAPMLKKAMEGIDGRGGGHEYACGAAIKSKDFNRFLEQMRAEIKKVEKN
jgi:single-stranded DNA-specific DHH superfamily exonuclease